MRLQAVADPALAEDADAKAEGGSGAAMAAGGALEPELDPDVEEDESDNGDGSSDLLADPVYTKAGLTELKVHASSLIHGICACCIMPSSACIVHSASRSQPSWAAQTRQNTPLQLSINIVHISSHAGERIHTAVQSHCSNLGRACPLSCAVGLWHSSGGAAQGALQA